MGQFVQSNKNILGSWLFRGFVVIGLLAIWPAWYALDLYQIRQGGKELRPSQPYAVVSAPYYLQNDSLWADDNLGNTAYRMASSGCLVSCLAAMLHQQGKHIDPSQFNVMLKEVDGYTHAGEVIWGKILEAFPDLRYIYLRRFAANDLEADLANGKTPAVKVRYFRRGIFHWVLIVGATEDDFLIMDPLHQDKKPIPLQTHGNVYAYRNLLVED